MKALTVPHLEKSGLISESRTDEEENWVTKLIGLYHDQLEYGAEIVKLTELFFNDNLDYNEEEMVVLKEEQVPDVLHHFKEELLSLESFDAAEIKAKIKATQKATGHKGKKLFMPIRVATTGQMHGPELPQSIELLGKEKVVARLDALLNTL